MSDYNSSLPIRTQNNGDVVIFIADGTTTSQVTTVKASSTAAATTDTSLVVALSPNSPLPAGSAVIGAVTQSGGPWTSNITQVGGSALALGQTTMSASIPVAFASNQSALAVTQSTSPWVTSDLADGSVSGGTAGTKSLLAGLIYNGTAPTLTTGQQASLQGDASGNLKVNIAASSGSMSVTQGTTPWVDNITQIGGSALALGQTTMSASIPVTIASNQSALTVSISGGTLAVTQSTSPWVTSDLADGSATGGTAGTKSLLGGAIYNSTAPTLTNGQQVGLQADASGNLKVDLATALPAGANSIGTVVLGAGTAIAGKMEITDGTNTSGVAAASTAASATQPALVVALSPNSPLPAGTAAIGSVLANLQVSNAAVSTSNPVPVTISDAVPGTPVQYYGTSVAVAAGASATITYTVATGHTFTLQRVWSSASGKIKAVVQNNGSTIFVGFNSTANPNIDMTLITPPTVAAGNTVTVTITNEDRAAFDVYATIEGNQN